MFAETHIAVIGAGIFGCQIAISLANAGCRVTLFERKDRIMFGASRNNQNRLHLGFHYPRDLETARQCKAGFQRFKEEFAESISTGFPNAYFIATSGSFTSPEAYLRFCNEAGLSYELLDVSAHAEVRGCALGLLSQEVVYDCQILQELLVSRIEQIPQIELVCGADVSDLAPAGRGYRLWTNRSATEKRFDAVVNCSYDEINRLTLQLGMSMPDCQFEYTVVPIVKLDIPRQGITVMDGPFMTLLPYGRSDKFLLYHVKHTVLETHIGPTRDPSWSDPGDGPFAQYNKEAFFERMRAACIEFVPSLVRARLVGFLEGPRMVLARRDEDDARPSIVTEHADGYLTVFSGKIDHSVWVAEEVKQRLAARFDERM